MTSPEALLAAILNRQTELADPDDLGAFAVSAVGYVRGRPWSEADTRLVWSSPAARHILRQARRAMIAEVDARWAVAANDRMLVSRAAASDAESIVLGETGVTMRIVRAATSGDWLVNLTLTPDALALLPPGIRIVLTDSGGLEWLAGIPDADGGIDAFWDHQGSPIDRLRAHGVALRFA